jgi:predicted DCC family thiol-disulfide oxidoreductase YuxK
MNQSEHILLFDGDCALCNGLVKFIIRRDKKQLYSFVALRSPTGIKILNEYFINPEKTDSVVLITEEKFFIKSEAIFRITNNIGGGWRLFNVFRILPLPFLNFCYDAVAQMRYRIFGKTTSCMLPPFDIWKKL